MRSLAERRRVRVLKDWPEIEFEATVGRENVLGWK
jgi:hypothetical protein